MIITYNEYPSTENLYNDVIKTVRTNYELRENVLITSRCKIELTEMRFQLLSHIINILPLGNYIPVLLKSREPITNYDKMY
jgi:hypothetical protein